MSTTVALFEITISEKSLDLLEILETCMFGASLDKNSEL